MKLICTWTLSLGLLIVACGSPTQSASPPSPSQQKESLQAKTSAGSTAAATAVAASPAQLTVGTVSKVFGYTPLWVAQRKGFLSEQALEVEEVVLEASTRAMQGLIAGSLHVTLAAPGATVLTKVGGEDVEVIGGLVNRSMYTLVGRPELRSPRELKGKVIATAGLTTGDILLLKRMLRAEGLNYPDDYSVLVMGGTPLRFTALASGNVDATLLLTPQNYQALDQGFSNLGEGYKYVKDYQFTGLNARGAWARENKDVVVRFLRAIVKAISWMHDPRNKQETVAIATEAGGTEARYNEMAYDEYIGTGAFPKDGKPSVPGIEQVIQELVDGGQLQPPLPSPQSVLNLSYTEEAIRR